LIKLIDLFRVAPPTGWKPTRGEWVVVGTVRTRYFNDVASTYISNAWAAVVYKVRGDWVWISRPAHKWATKPVPIESLRPHPTMVGARCWDKVGGETAADVVNVYNAAEAIKVAEDRQKPQAWRELDFDD